MKTLLLSVLVSLVAAGCGSKGGSAAECSAAADKGVGALIEKSQKSMEAHGAPPEMVAKLAEMSGKFKDLLTKHCTDEKWPKDVISCFAAASSQPEMTACREKLPKEQSDKLRSDEMQLMSSMMGGMRPPGMGGMGGMHRMGSAAPEGSAAPAPAPESAGSAAPAPAGSAK
jgi:small lipoprotein (TIGR04454 family)